MGRFRKGDVVRVEGTIEYVVNDYESDLYIRLGDKVFILPKAHAQLIRAKVEVGDRVVIDDYPPDTGTVHAEVRGNLMVEMPNGEFRITQAPRVTRVNDEPPLPQAAE